MRLAIIGCTGHVPYALATVEARDDLELVAIAPGNPEENFDAFCENVQKRGLNPKVYEDWRTLLANEDVDVAAIGAWFCYNAEIAIECLKKKIHVYCEKPLATTYEKLDELTAAWEESGCSLDGMFGLRYTPWFIAMQKAIADGEIGQVRQVHAQKSYRLGKRARLYYEQKLYGGILPWVAIHAMDWATQVGGKCQSVTGLHCSRENGGHGELEVSSAAMMVLENGVIATVTADFLRPTGSARHDDDRVRVTGTRGMIEAMDGKVCLENENKKRELDLPKEPAPMDDFLDSIGTPRAKELALAALSVTKAALDARESANQVKL